ncbi:MAG: hypothetical protein CMM77_12950 [Rhodospirillaceae bacterium]|nr:hypothetical protein [Magnetovibrio sp.]MAY68020.1 hypothetical protein [Rhodospirillaceae bacterium]
MVHDLLAGIEDPEGPLIDIACGSGLMFRKDDAVVGGRFVFGLDYNEDACQSAYENGLPVIRGDAFHLPVTGASVGRAVCGQFLQTQSDEGADQFLFEAARILKPGGHLIMLWRSRSWLHDFAHWIHLVIDKLRRRQMVDHRDHTIDMIKKRAAAFGLTTVTAGRTLPFGKPALHDAGSLLARAVGASNCVVLRREIDAADQGTVG